MLSIKDLHIEVNGTQILAGVGLDIKPGEIHAILGPNGSGKSTLAHALMGNPKYKVVKGKIELDRKNINGLKANERAARGLFLAFQQPKEITGVRVATFIQAASSALRKAQGKKPLNAIELRTALSENLSKFSLEPGFINRNVNEGFSGGEKKKFEALQMVMFSPKYAILDEIDSGLDIDALKNVAAAIKKLCKRKSGVLIITHSTKILHYLKPKHVHVMIKGKIVMSGGSGLAEKIEKKGFKSF